MGMNEWGKNGSGAKKNRNGNHVIMEGSPFKMATTKTTVTMTTASRQKPIKRDIVKTESQLRNQESGIKKH